MSSDKGVKVELAYQLLFQATMLLVFLVVQNMRSTKDT